MQSAIATPHRVLVVDDDDTVRELHARCLRARGCDVQCAGDGPAAIEALRISRYDVVVSDIDMPGMSGIALLENIRSTDLDIPVIFVTGLPSMETAIKALSLGAMRYLLKPVPLSDLTQVVADAARFHSIARAKRAALELTNTGSHFAGDQAGLGASFDRALHSLRLVYQPIVSLSRRSTHAYEVLLRSEEPLLPNPLAVLDAGERLGRLVEVGRTVRQVALAQLAHMPPGTTLFINAHPVDLFDDTLVQFGQKVAAAGRGRIVLEVTERSSLDRLPGVRERAARLRDVGFQIAVDDFGTGYSGLSSLALLEPEVVKLDMALVRGIDRDKLKHTVVTTIVAMCRELGIAAIAEGVETEDECDALVVAGCDLFQGYLFARPSPTLDTPRFPDRRANG